MVSKMTRKLVYGVGINDAEYFVKPVVNGKRDLCKFYDTWVHMLARCFSKKVHARQKTYEGCSVCDEWLTFSKFKGWMQTQDWTGKELDKDIINFGNKKYSPDNCAFVSSKTNCFVTEIRVTNGDLPIGVYFNKPSKKFLAQCYNPFTGKNENLGRFICKNQAHQAWKKRKHELACQLAEIQTDDRVANALRVRYL